MFHTTVFSYRVRIERCKLILSYLVKQQQKVMILTLFTAILRLKDCRLNNKIDSCKKFRRVKYVLQAISVYSTPQIERKINCVAIISPMENERK